MWTMLHLPFAHRRLLRAMQNTVSKRIDGSLANVAAWSEHSASRDPEFQLLDDSSGNFLFSVQRQNPG